MTPSELITNRSLNRQVFEVMLEQRMVIMCTAFYLNGCGEFCYAPQRYPSYPSDMDDATAIQLMARGPIAHNDNVF